MAWWGRHQQDAAELEEQPRPRSRFVRLMLLALAGAALWFAPNVLVLTRVRERPLERISRRLEGTLASGSASWSWFGPIEYRNLVLRDREGIPVLAIEKATLDHGLAQLARQFLLEPQPQLGTLRLSGVSLVTSIDADGSDVERVLAPWSTSPATGPTPGIELEVVDAELVLLDAVHGDAWRIGDLVAAARLTSEGLEGWTVAGRAVHAGRGAVASDAIALLQQRRADGVVTGSTDVQVATQATAVMTHEGGFSLSSPASLPDRGGASPEKLVFATNRLPLGISELCAVRFGWSWVLDGHADIRVDLELPTPAVAAGEAPAEPRGTTVRGRMTATDVHLLDAHRLQERFHIDRVEAPFDCVLDGGSLTIRQLTAESPLFSFQASGRVPFAAADGFSWLEQAAADDFTFAGDIDLAEVARGRPGGVELRPDVRVTDGRLRVAAVSRAENDRRVVEVRVSSEALEAVQGSRQLRWDEPLSAWLRGSRAFAEPAFRIEEARVISPAFEITASSQPPLTDVTWTADLARLIAEVGEILDFQGMTLEGTARGSCRLSEPHPNGARSGLFSASVDGFVLELPGYERWSDDQLRLEATGVGMLVPGGVAVDQGHLHVEAGTDTGDVTVTSPWLLAGFAVAAPANAAALPTAELALTGDLAKWHTRLAAVTPAVSLDGTTLGGRCDLSATLASMENGWRFTRAGGELNDVVVSLADGRTLEEPRVVGSGAGTLFSGGRGFEISSAEVLTATLSLRTGGFTYLPAAGALIGGQRLPLIRGVGQWQADVGRLEQWVVAPLAAASWPASGRAWGAFEVSEAKNGVSVRLSATGNDLALARVPASSVLGIGAALPPSEVWREPRATFQLEVTRDTTQPSGAVTINALALDSSTASFTATGSLRDLAEQGFLELSGTATYDWDAISRLATPWTGGRVRLAGSGGRPFAIRGPLGGMGGGSGESPEVGTVGLPVDLPQESRPTAPLERTDDWLAAARGLSGERPRAAGMPQNVSLASSSSQRESIAWLRSVSLETTLGWQAADLFGLPVQAGDMPMRLLDGQLAFGPFDIAASGGRLRGAPWVRFFPGPVELVVPPGRVVDRLDISQGVANRWMTWVAPLLGQATQIVGRISVDTTGAKIPLADPFAGASAGQVLFEGVEVTPGPPAQPLVTLIGRLQGLLDPRFGVGEKVVLMRVRPEPARIWLHERRIWHDGLVIDTGQLTIRTSGSVAADGTLAMDVEMAFRGDIAGQTPIVAALLRTPLLIPLKGTIDRPQFDPSAIDKIFARIAENTANAVIGDGINRGLEALFGNPQPPPAPR